MKTSEPGRLKLLYVAPERLAGERFVASLAGRNIVAAGDRRGPLHQRVGPQLPARIPQARPAGEAAPGRPRSRPDRDRHARGRRLDRPGLRDRARRRRPRQLPPGQPGAARHPLPGRRPPRAAPRPDGESTARPGHRLCDAPEDRRGDRRRSWPIKAYPAEAYHAGLGDEVRHAVQERFMASTDGIVVATIAFGMGIDKADIRTVLHYNLPKGPESYAQEIGRAGRDGLPARCELFACAEDVTTLENFAFGDTPDARGRRLAGRGGDGAGARVRPLDLRPLAEPTTSVRWSSRPCSPTWSWKGSIEATGPFYAEYKFKSDRPIERDHRRVRPASDRSSSRGSSTGRRGAGSGRPWTSRRRRRRWASLGRGSSRRSATWKSRGS